MDILFKTIMYFLETFILKTPPINKLIIQIFLKYSKILNT